MLGYFYHVGVTSVVDLVMHDALPQKLPMINTMPWMIRITATVYGHSVMKTMVAAEPFCITSRRELLPDQAEDGCPHEAGQRMAAS